MAKPPNYTAGAGRELNSENVCKKKSNLISEGTDDTFDFCTSCVEGSRDLFNQLLDSTPRGKFGNIGKH